MRSDKDVSEYVRLTKLEDSLSYRISRGGDDVSEPQLKKDLKIVRAQLEKIQNKPSVVKYNAIFDQINDIQEAALDIARKHNRKLYDTFLIAKSPSRRKTILDKILDNAEKHKVDTE